MSAIIPAHGNPRQLERPAEPDYRITTDDVDDKDKLAQLLMGMLRSLASVRRRWWPNFVDHQDRVVDGTGTTLYRFPHGVGGRVNWWPVDWVGAAGPQLARHAKTDDNTLVLVSYVAGTMTLRIEEAG